LFSKFEFNFLNMSGLAVWEQHPQIEDAVPVPLYGDANAYLGTVGGDALIKKF
jgi:hypothetical protein